jgi:hypothetical protein
MQTSAALNRRNEINLIKRKDNYVMKEFII